MLENAVEISIFGAFRSIELIVDRFYLDGMYCTYLV
jgi:hypothetical protein